MDKITTLGKRFVDEYGRERIFNGINVCDKGVYDASLGKRTYCHEWEKELITPFYESGFNIMRLGFTWDAIEPQPGQYNMAYIQFLKDTLDRCEKAEIYVYLDIHQDLYSGFGNGNGDGAPAWATLTGRHTYKRAKKVWAEGYFWGKAVHKAFDNFWDNVPIGNKNIQDYYADMWQFVVKELGSHPAVIGFDLMNEPFPGKSGGKVFRLLIKGLIATTLFDKSTSKREILSCIFNKEKSTRIANQYTAEHLRKITSKGDALIKKFDLEKYSPFFNRVSSAIREVNEDGILIMENCYYSNLSIPCSTPAVEVNGKRDKLIAYAPHAYDIIADTPAYKHAGTQRIKSIFDEQKRTQERLGAPVIVGEWGGFIAGNEWHYHAEYLLSLFDSNNWSNTYWAYFDGLFESELMPNVLTRPYPRAVTGKIASFEHNRKENSFTLEYSQDKVFDVPTVIFAHKPVVRIAVDGVTATNAVTNLVGSDSSTVSINTGVGSHRIEIFFKG